MGLQELKQGTIRRKDNIPDEDRTPGKDKAADWIQENIINEGRWPVNVIDIEDEAGWSRQHLTNVLKDYFVRVDQEPEDTEEDESESRHGEITITVPDDVENESDFWRGVAEASRV